MWIAYDQYKCSRIFERFVNHNLIDFLKNTVTLSIFELEKCSLHQNGVEFQKKNYWYHYQHASPAPTSTIRHQKFKKAPGNRVKVDVEV